MVRKTSISNFSIDNVLLICLFLIFAVKLNAQVDKKYIREGNREYSKNKFSESEILYRKAIDKNKQSPEAVFNIGDALYKQNKFEDAGKQFIENTNISEDKAKKSAGLYNLGNSLLKANKVKESIDAYKNSLKLKPDSRETKYNLAYAQDLLKQQEQQKQQQQQQQNKNNQDKKKDQEKDQNKDQNKDKNDQNNDRQKDQKNKQDQQQQQQGISKDDAERLLNAIANDEKNVQQKVKLAKAEKARVMTVRNW
jgi:Ca-activated chloride channel homolog